MSLSPDNNFLGMAAVIFFGVIEDIEDPKEMGRVRVRCFGYHTRDKILIKTEDLPWALVMTPVSSASVSGIGTPMHGLVQGSYVMGIFQDGVSAQLPLVMGSIPSQYTEMANTSFGFNDPKGKYPRYINEPDVNKLNREVAWNDHSSTINKSTNRKIGIPTATDNLGNGSTSWNEPLPRNGQTSLYSKNFVYESESGHIKEIDDTPSNERTHDYHPSGSYTETYSDGTEMKKIVGDALEIIVKGKSVYIKGNCNITIDGNLKQLVKGNYNLQIDGHYTQKIGGNFSQNITGSSQGITNGIHITSLGNVVITGSRIDFNP